MRRRELAVGVAGTAGVTEIGEIVQVAVGKRTAHLHRGEYCAKPLAIAAGIADRHQTVGFLQDLGAVQGLVHLVRPLRSSQFWISPATSALFSSIMIMCELPLMPCFGRSMISTSPPAALKPSAKATPVARIFGQRESRSI